MFYRSRNSTDFYSVEFPWQNHRNTRSMVGFPLFQGINSIPIGIDFLSFQAGNFIVKKILDFFKSLNYIIETQCAICWKDIVRMTLIINNIKVINLCRELIYHGEAIVISLSKICIETIPMI